MSKVGTSEIEVRGLCKHFGTLEVLRGVDFDVRQGEVVGLIGPSGSGKSTLLRCLNLLEVPDEGTISWQSNNVAYREMSGAEISLHRRHMGMVFQHFNLFPHRRAIDNVMEGLTQVLNTPKAGAEELALSLLESVGLKDKANAWPSQLSGGQKQRVAIARALAMKPKVMLLDEVTSALDIEVVAEINDLLRSIAAEGMTMVVVTHDLGFARQVADTLHFMDQGRIIESGTPDEVLSLPQHERTKAFMAKVFANS